MGANGSVMRATISKLEEKTKLTRQTLYKHIRRAGIKAVNQRYPIREVCDAILDHRKDDNRNLEVGGVRARKLDLECRILKIRLLQLEGELVSATGVTQQVGDMVAAFSTRILAIPARIAAELYATATSDRKKELVIAEVEDIVRRTLEEALEDLANYDPEPTGDNPPSR